MTTSNGVPATYTTRWSSHAYPPQGTFLGNDSALKHGSTSTQPRKYNTSCNTCRKSRVKCSGGVPCRRCAASSNFPPCTYSPSQRRGKRKANPSDEPSNPSNLLTQGVSPSNTNMAIQPNYNLETPIGSNQPNDINTAISQENIFPLDQALMNNNLEVSLGAPAGANSPSLTEIMDILNSPPPTQSSSPKERQKCPNACYAAIHDLSGNLDSVIYSPGQTGLDDILALIQRAFQQSEQYLACENCDAGCPRFMNLALLHQRQVTLLCELAKGPADHLSNDTTQTTLGNFQPAKKDDLCIKQLMLRHATRDIKKSVDAFHEGARGFEERYIAGTLELGEAGKLNLKFLLDVSTNLSRRLDCVRVLLERDDWASDLKGL